MGGIVLPGDMPPMLRIRALAHLAGEGDQVG
jgi:hypothetical protein